MEFIHLLKQLAKKGLGDPTHFFWGNRCSINYYYCWNYCIQYPHQIAYNHFISFIDKIELRAKKKRLLEILNEKREHLGLDLTPIIDVVFIRLIFFLVTSVFKKEELALMLDLPSSNAKEMQIKQEQIFIELSVNKLAIKGIEVSFESLEDNLKAIKNKDDSVIVRIDKKVPYERVVKVLDLLQKYNLNNLALVTNEEKKN